MQKGWVGGGTKRRGRSGTNGKGLKDTSVYTSLLGFPARALFAPRWCYWSTDCESEKRMKVRSGMKNEGNGNEREGERLTASVRVWRHRGRKERAAVSRMFERMIARKEERV